MILTPEQISKMSIAELMEALKNAIEENDKLLKQEKLVYKELNLQLIDQDLIVPPPKKCPLCGQPLDLECKDCREPICECNDARLCDKCKHRRHMAEYLGETKHGPDAKSE